MKINPCLTPNSKINSSWIKDLKVKKSSLKTCDLGLQKRPDIQAVDTIKEGTDSSNPAIA